jgi:hypothetical protein
MSKKIIGIGFLVAFAFILTISGCTKNTSFVIDNSPAVTGTVSFAKDLQPILTNSCATAGCHSGSVAPNLSDASAYTALKSGTLLNTATPENSDVYLWITGKRTPAMPLGGIKNPSNLNAIMLAWIKQGAKNN